MRPIQHTIAILFALLISITANAQPRISFTFDDGALGERPGYTFDEWNDRILNTLDGAGVKAVFFVAGYNKIYPQGKYLLKTWDERGHIIANHTFSHPNYNSEDVTFEQFRQELLKNDTIINQYDHYAKLFRFAYLKEGNTPEKVNAFRSFMEQEGYRNGYVTIDASDWYIDGRLQKRLKENPDADVTKFKEFYIAHLLERATYYEEISYALTGRHISHTLLLHHNLAAALFLDDAIDMFKQEGWEIMSADEAFTDPIFQREPEYAGESLIWALAKDSGKYNNTLRYPAEDSRYEEEKMDKLGL